MGIGASGVTTPFPAITIDNGSTLKLCNEVNFSSLFISQDGILDLSGHSITFVTSDFGVCPGGGLGSSGTITDDSSGTGTTMITFLGGTMTYGGTIRNGQHGHAIAVTVGNPFFPNTIVTLTAILTVLVLPRV